MERLVYKSIFWLRPVLLFALWQSRFLTAHCQQTIWSFFGFTNIQLKIKSSRFVCGNLFTVSLWKWVLVFWTSFEFYSPRLYFVFYFGSRDFTLNLPIVQWFTHPESLKTMHCNGWQKPRLWAFYVQCKAFHDDDGEDSDDSDDDDVQYRMQPATFG